MISSSFWICWTTQSIKFLIRCQLQIIRAVSFGSVPLSLSQTKIVSFKSSTFSTNALHFVRFCHTSLYSSKGILYAKHYLLDGHPLTGNSLVELAFCVVPAVMGYLIFSFALSKRLELAALCNSLFLNGTLRTSKLFKFLIWNMILLSIGISTFNAVMVIATNWDPIMTNLQPHIGNRYVFIVLRCLLRMYEIWNFSYVSTLGCFILYDGMFGSYVALYELMVDLHFKSKNKCQKYLKDSVEIYWEVQLYAGMANDCFMETLALPIKILLILLAVILGTAVLDSKLREATTTTAFCVGLYTLFSVYFLLAMGYAFPGKVNAISKEVLETWKGNLGEIISDKRISHQIIREFRKSTKALQEIKLHFGASNYYDKGTSLVILTFVVDTTINWVLLIK